MTFYDFVDKHFIGLGFLVVVIVLGISNCVESWSTRKKS